MIILLALVLSPVFVMAEEPLAIRGIEVDKPVNCEQLLDVAKHNLERVSDACKNNISFPPMPGVRSVSILFAVDFLDANATMLVGLNDNKEVISVRVVDINYSAALNGLTAKYGKPEVKLSTVRNAYGATFEQVENVWGGPGGPRLKLSKHGMKLNQADLVLIGVKARESYEKAKAAEGEANKGKL